MAKHGSNGEAVVLSLAGLAAGLAAWALTDILPDRLDDARWLMTLSGAAASFFGSLLLSLGPLRAGTALLAAMAIALPVTALFWGASLQFGPVAPFIDSGLPVLALILLVVLSLPFAIAALRFDLDPTNYAALYETAWSLVTRTIAAAAFLALFWGAAFLGDVLLKLVQIDGIERALDVAPVPFALTGLAGGLALAVAHRMSGVIGPDVLIQLLRMLLPLVAAVTAIFLGALALRGAGGLDRLFGEVSAAAAIMAMGFGATALIAAAVERGGLRAVQSGAMRGVVAALALMLPVLGLLAAFAIRVRVAQYGWTPERLAAAMVAAILCGYGATHAVAVLARRDWMQRIRQGNVAMAAIAILAAALWLNPVIGPYDIAARSLEARLRSDAGSASARDLDLLANDYGRAGQAALDRIAETAAPDLRRRVANLRSDVPPASPDDEARPALVADLRRAIALRPEGAAFPETAFQAMSVPLLRRLATACTRSTPGGAKGCVALVADLLPTAAGDEVLVFYITDRNDISILARSADSGIALTLQAAARDWPDDPALIDALLAGDATLGPLPVNALSLGDHVLFVLP